MAKSTVPKFLGETAGDSTNNQIVVWPLNCGFYLGYDYSTSAFSIFSRTLYIVPTLVAIQLGVSVYHLT